ncbi:hypothetical protein C0992_003478, partial [Termitomyces sp. T32_za158]
MVPIDDSPVPGLKVFDDGYLCTKCNYCAMTESSFTKHWNEHHKTLLAAFNSRYTRGPVQTFFRPIPTRFFRINLHPTTAPPNVFEIFLAKEAQSTPSTVHIPDNAREIPPLLTCTQWHLHVKPYLSDRSKRESLHSIVKPPLISPDNHLWNATKAYFVSRDAKAWSAHKNDQTLYEYGRVLYNLAYSTLISLKGHASGYLYPFSENMKPSGQKILAALDQNLPITIDLFHSWIYPFLSHHPAPTETDKWSMVLQCWLAIYTMKIEGHFAAPSDVAPLLARLEYCARGCTLFEAYKQIKATQGDLYSTLEALCLQNLKPGSFTPFNVLLEYQRFVSALVFNQSAAPSTDISPDASRVSYRDKTLVLSNWKIGLRRMYDECVSIITELCGGTVPTIHIPEDFIDDMSNMAYGFSWVESLARFNDPYTLLQQLMLDASLNLCAVDSDGNLSWNAHIQIAFMKKTARLNELLAMLHHTVPGQPSRIAELCDFRIRNGLRGRNIFISHGADWFVTRRVKSETLVQREVFIPVKLPSELSTIFHQYLLFIRPVEIVFARNLWEQKVSDLYSEYLYLGLGSRLLEDVFYVTFKRLTEDFFNVRIGVRGYRQMIVVVARTYLGSEYELDVEEEESDSLIEQRNHGVSADRRCYGIQSQYLHTISMDLMFRFGRISEYWWRLTGFAPGQPPLLPLDIRRQHSLQNHPIPPTTDANNHLSKSNLPQALVPSGFESHICDLFKTMINDSVLPNIGHLVRQEIATAFTEFQLRSSGSIQSIIPSSTAPPLTSPLIIPSTPIQSSPLPTPSSSIQSAIYWLRLITGNSNAKFRSKEQELLIQSALNSTQNILGIMPTGGGKSYVFFIPAFADQSAAQEMGTHEIPKKTITVVPNKALLSDMLRKATDLGIRAIQWKTSTPRNVSNNASLLLIALESITHPKFKQFYRESEGKIARLCIDESHQMLTSESYRSKFTQLGELAQFAVQRIFLTATLPPALVEHFLVKNFLPDSTTIIRAPTFRSNLRYHVVHVEERVRPVKEVIIDLAHYLNTNIFSPYSRGIIFCNSIADVEDLAPSFNGFKSHSQMESGERQQLQDLWYQGGPNHWMVATTGWLHGIDHPNVDAVIFNGLPYGLLNFVQGAGRAGRGGQEANVFLLHPTHQQWIAPLQNEVDIHLRRPISDFLFSQICHNRILTREMDGQAEEQDCHDIFNGLLCDICNPDHALALEVRKFLQPQRNPSPVFDDGDWDDNSLMQLDDAIFSQNALPPPPIHAQPIPTCQSTSSSIGICLDHARYQALTNNKLGKVKELTSMTKMLAGYAGGAHKCYCFICWAWKDKLIPKTADHQFFLQCKSIEDKFVAHGFGWMDQLKKKF